MAKSKNKKPRPTLQQRINKEKDHTIAVLAKALSAFLRENQAIYVEVHTKKHLIHWDGPTIRIKSAKDFEGFQDGLLLEERVEEKPETIIVEGQQNEESLRNTEGT